MTDVHQQRLDSHAVDRRAVPEAVSDLPGEQCWHCHNSVDQMHILDCPECDVVVRGPAVQDHATCTECGALMECVRYTWRLVEGDDGSEGPGPWLKRCYHPETGERMSRDALEAEGFR